MSDKFEIFVVAAEYDMVLVVGWLGGEVGGNCPCLSTYCRRLK